MKPALTAKGWSNILAPEVPPIDYRLRAGGWAPISGDEEGETRHMTAALCLHEQPFGFTRLDAVNHRMMAKAANRTARDFADGKGLLAEREAAWHKSMADRIEALLPPEQDYTVYDDGKPLPQGATLEAGKTYSVIVPLPPEDK